jgi:hypothetical protein
MTIDRIVLAFAGTVVLISLLLAAFVGLNLLQSSFTGFCPLARIPKSLGIKPGAAFG